LIAAGVIVILFILFWAAVGYLITR